MSELGYFDYVRAAFKQRAELPGLGAMPVNALGLAAFAVLGLANPGFWFLGIAAEIGYLTYMAGNERFRKLVRGQAALADKRSYASRVQAAVERLSPESQHRYRQLLLESREIVGISETLGERDLAGLRGIQGSGLNQLLWIFLRLLTSREVLLSNIDRVDRDKLTAEIEQAETRLAKAEQSPALARSLSGTLEIKRKRLENYDRAQRSLKVIDAELERIEQQVVLVREEAAVSGKAEILSQRLDQVTSTLSETNSWMEQHAEIFGELGADPLGSAPADLPEVPAALETEG